MSRESREELIQQAADAFRLLSRASDELDEAVANALDISRKDLRCMEVLHFNRRMTAGEMAQATGLTSGAITALIDRMEERGYLRRIRDENDRRKVLVEPTDKCDQAAIEMYGDHDESCAAALHGLSNEQLRTVLDAVNRACEMNHHRTAKVRGLPGA